MARSYPYLEMLEERSDFIFLTDHGEKELFNNIRINVLDIVSEKKILINLFPRFLIEGFLLFTLGLAKKKVVYVTFGSNKRTYILMILQMLISPFSTPKIHLIFDCLWEPRKGILGKIIINIRKLLINSVVEKCIVYGKRDIESFNIRLGISKDKLVFFPYHHTLDGFDFDVKDGTYIFSGGTDGRDYELLMHICEELALPLKIATLDQNIIMKSVNYKMTDVKSVSPAEFRNLMAGSRIVTIPYGQSIILRTGGHQTMINAMLMGKTLICYNEAITDGYVENNKTGFVVPVNNVDEYKKILYEMYYSDEKRRKIGQNARDWVIEQELNQIGWIKNIYDYAASFYYSKQGS